MPAASYISQPIERSFAFVKNSSTSNFLFGSNNKLNSDVDLSAHNILSSTINFKKYEDNSLRYDKKKYLILTPELNNKIDTLCNNNKQLINKNCSSLSLNKTNNKDYNGNNSNNLLPKPERVLYPPEKIILGWQGRVPVGAGLINAINTCYLNSSLQALFHIPSFHNWLLNDTEHQKLCEKQNGHMFECLVCAMRKTLENCQNKSGSSIRPEFIIKKLKLIARHLEHHRQEDSHEFLNYLIEGMQKSYLKAIPGANKLDSYSKETTPIDQIFGSYLRTEVTCSSCHNVSTSYTHGTELSLDIRQSSCLDDSLTNFFAKETLSGDNLYKCEKCKKKVEATKRFSVDKPPNVLRLQLKRFNYHGFKNSRPVTVPNLLDFGKFMHKSHHHSQIKYRLVSAVIHHGSSPDSGHYTCIGSTSSGVYHYFDDEMVKGSNLSLLTNAYIVIYELLPSSTKPSHVNNYNGNYNNNNNHQNHVLKLNNQNGNSSSSSSSLPSTSFKNNNENHNNNNKFIGPQLPNGNNANHNNNTSKIVKRNDMQSLYAKQSNSNNKVQSTYLNKNNNNHVLRENGIDSPNKNSCNINNNKIGGSLPNLNASPIRQQNGFKSNTTNGNEEKNGGDAGPSGGNGVEKKDSPFKNDNKLIIPLKYEKIKTNGFNNLSNGNGTTNGISKKTKLVDYDSDDESDNGDDETQNNTPSCSNDKKNGGQSSASSSSSSEKRPASFNTPFSSKKIKPNLNGWTVLSAEEEEKKYEKDINGNPSYMEWNVESIITPPSKSPLYQNGTSSASSSRPSTPSNPSTPIRKTSEEDDENKSKCVNNKTITTTQSSAGDGKNVTEYLNSLNNHSSYGSNNVTSWSNEPSTLIENKTTNGKFAPNGSKFPRHFSKEDDDEDMDRGKVKKQKTKYEPTAYSRGNNPFNHYNHHKNNGSSNSYNRNNYNNNRSGGSDKYNNYNNSNNNNYYSSNKQQRRQQFRHRPYYQNRR